MHGHRNI